MTLQTKRVINGTFGELWLDGDKVSECFGLNAKVEIEKEDVPVCGKMGVDSKILSYKGKGSVKLYKVNSRMIQKISADLKAGTELRFQILSALKDPAAYGSERVLIKDASFDDLTLVDWEVKKKGEVECPFTFTDWTDLDTITPREG